MPLKLRPNHLSDMTMELAFFQRRFTLALIFITGAILGIATAGAALAAVDQFLSLGRLEQLQGAAGVGHRRA